MAMIRSGEVSIFFEDQGDGQPVLLLHGHTLDGRIFDDLASRLVTAGRRVLRLDLRGHGRSERPPRGYHWVDHCADAVAVLDASGVEKATIIGFSLGGGIALEMAVERPERVDDMVLMAPVMPDRAFEADFLANLKSVASVARSEGIRAAMQGPWMRSPLFAVSLKKPGVREAVAKIVGDFPGADYLAEARDKVERDWMMPDRLDEITASTLVLVGEFEMPGFRAFSEEAAKGIPKAKLEIISGSGHLLPLEANDEVARLILEHLR